MRVPNPEKVEIVNTIMEQVKDSEIVILTKYIGIDAEEATELRSKLRSESVQFKVFKNTLAKRALDELGLSEAVPFMDGPTAWAFCKDPVAPARVLKDFGKTVPLVEMTGGILEGRVVSKDQLIVLANLPSRDVLLAQVVGTIAAPLRNLVGVLSATPRNLVNVLDQIRKQNEEGEAAA